MKKTVIDLNDYVDELNSVGKPKPEKRRSAYNPNTLEIPISHFDSHNDYEDDYDNSDEYYEDPYEYEEPPVVKKTVKKKTVKKKAKPTPPPVKKVKKKKKHRIRNFFRTILLVLVACLILLTTGASRLLNKTQTPEGNTKNGTLLGNQFSVLVVGVDNRGNDFSGRSDTMMLCTVNKKDKRILVTSVMRDIAVDIDGYGTDKLNAAYAYGGIPLMQDTLKQNLTLSVNRTVLFNFTTVREVIDAIGGITVTLTQEEVNAVNEILWITNQEVFYEPPYYDQIEAPGTITLNGKQALAYSRNRTSAGSDFDRTSRQRDVMEACLAKVKSMNPLELYRAIEKIMPMIMTDVSGLDAIGLLPMILQIRSYEIEKFSIPAPNTFENVMINGAAMLKIDKEENIRLWKEALSKKKDENSPN